MAYSNGEGVRQDYEEARKWYRKAIENGDENAKTLLELMETIKELDELIKDIQ